LVAFNSKKLLTVPVRKRENSLRLYIFILFVTQTPSNFEAFEVFPKLTQIFEHCLLTISVMSHTVSPPESPKLKHVVRSSASPTPPPSQSYGAAHQTHRAATLGRTKIALQERFDDSHGGSSPSEAYAELKISSGTPPDSTTTDQPVAKTHAAAGHDKNNSIDYKSSARLRDTRSISPAKRTASEMEQDDNMCPPLVEGIDEMDVDKSTETSKTDVSTPNIDESVAVDASSSSTEVEDEVPSIDDQVQQVLGLTKKIPEEEGMRGYCVSRKWLGRVVTRSKFSAEMGTWDKSCLDGEIGLINNSDITDPSAPKGLVDERGLEFVSMRKGLRINDEYEILTEPAWELIGKWYGLEARQKPVVRYQHKLTEDETGDWQFETYPPVFTLRKYYKGNKPAQDRNAPQILASKYKKYNDFVKAVKEKIGIPLNTKITIHRVLEVQSTSEGHSSLEPSSMPTPAASREPSPNRAVQSMYIGQDDYQDLYHKSQIEELSVDDQSMNSNYNGSVKLNTLGLTVDQTLVIVEGAQKAAKSETKRIAPKSLTIMKEPVSEPSSGRASPLGGIMTRGRNRQAGRTKGTVGLTNLGNTCYMNSALQCIRACKELSLFFLGRSIVSV
jgi:ubiquitin carboxyl-terminal hydrolase 4/11